MASPRSPKLPSPAECPVCGEDVPRGALACPRCGADHRSGWRVEEEDSFAGEDSFDYDAFVHEEFGRQQIKPAHLSTFWWIAAILITAAVIILCLHGVM